MVFKYLKKRVSHFQHNGEVLYMVDEENRVLKFDKDLLLVGGFKIKFPNNKPNEKGVKIDKELKYLAITHQKNVSVYDLINKKHVALFSRKDDCLSVALDDIYLVSGGVSGEIKFYNLETKKEIFTLTRHKDFITDLEIDREFNEVYVGAYDKAVLFVDTMTFRKKERYLHTREVKKIERKKYLVSADKIADILKWSEVHAEKKDRVDFYKEFRDFWIDENFLVLLLSNKVVIYDLEEEVILNDKFMEIKDGDKICVFNNFLIISDINGMIHKFDLFEDEKKLLDFVLKEDFKSAYELIDKNPFLKRTKAYEKMDHIIEAIIKRAKLLFEVDKEKALELLDKLLVVPALRGKVSQIIRDFENISKFKFAIKTKNYALAYDLANKYPLLKETKYYKYLEKVWEVTLNKALRLLKEGKIVEAKEVLEPFLGVPEKLNLINFILKNAQKVFLLREKLAERDYKGFFDLIKLNPELKYLPEYQRLMEYAQKVYERAKEYFLKEEFEKAKKLATILYDFPDFKEKAAILLKKIEIALSFQRALAEKNYEKVFEIMETYSFIKELPSCKKFMSEIYEKFKKSERLISQNKKYEAIEEIKNFQNSFIEKRIKEMLK